MDKADIKRMKEEFVSNLEGTSRWEIFCLISVLPFSILLGMLRARHSHVAGGRSSCWLTPCDAAVMVQQKVQLFFPSLADHKANK
jgi:hypothetical protein